MHKYDRYWKFGQIFGMNGDRRDSSIKKVFWVVGFAALIGTTLHGVVATIREYVVNPTLTDISVQEEHRQDLPELLVCLPNSVNYTKIGGNVSAEDEIYILLKFNIAEVKNATVSLLFVLIMIMICFL